MSLLPASMKRIRSKQLIKRDYVVFPNVCLWDFFQRPRAANSIVGGQNWLKFKLIHDFINVLINCKFEKDRIQEKVMTTIFRRSKAGNSVVRGGIWPKFILIQAFMHVLITRKYEKDPMKNSGKYNDVVFLAS